MSRVSQPLDDASESERDHGVVQACDKWFAWYSELRANGYPEDLKAPHNRAGEVGKNSRKVTEDGRLAEDMHHVCGYIVLEAKSLALAVELAMGCPILEEGGSVEVRPIPGIAD